MKKYKSCLYIFILFGFLYFPAQSFGFIPTSENLVNYMLKQKGSDFRNFRLPESKIIYVDEEKSVAMDIKLYYSSSGVFRADTLFGQQTKIYLESLEKAVTIQGEEMISENISNYFLFKDIFLFGDSENLLKLLRKRGCDTKSVRLDRKDGKIYFVIGDSDSEMDKDFAELWIDKETYLPYYYKICKNHESVSFKFFNWINSGSFKYPGLIDAFHDEIKVRSIESEKIDKNFKIDGLTLFDIEKFIKVYKKDEIKIDEEINPVDSIEKIFQ